MVRDGKVPVAKYADLPEDTRDFLEDMTREDVEILATGIRWLRNILIILRFAKWLAGAAVVGFTSAAALTDSFGKFKGFFR